MLLTANPNSLEEYRQAVEAMLAVAALQACDATVRFHSGGVEVILGDHVVWNRLTGGSLDGGVTFGVAVHRALAIIAKQRRGDA